MVVDLDDLGLETGAEEAGCAGDELRQDRHADAHVGGDDRPGARGLGAQRGILLPVEPGRADDQGGAALGGDPRVRERRDGGGEVEHDVLGAADRAEVAADRHAERRAAGHLARVAPDSAVPGRLDRAGDREVRILARQRHQQPAHASRRPADDERDAVRQARTPGAPSRASSACRCSRR